MQINDVSDTKDVGNIWIRNYLALGECRIQLTPRRRQGAQGGSLWI